MNEMKMTNETYDTLKFLVTVFAPALTALIAGLGLAGLIPNSEVIVTVIGLVTVFVGRLIGISSENYNKKD
jgi:VIT1/CCC1 family predicted Fe2+/Mn2+ transporter